METPQGCSFFSRQTRRRKLRQHFAAFMPDASLPVTNFFVIVKIAELASQGFWPFGRTAIVIRSRIAAL
jgi:hypothetical protein